MGIWGKGTRIWSRYHLSMLYFTCFILSTTDYHLKKNTQKNKNISISYNVDFYFFFRTNHVILHNKSYKDYTVESHQKNPHQKNPRGKVLNLKLLI